ncbi:hypothetical protein TON_0859 [Thermococcus onnurineus NA1]|uniref:Uncharacterized protein n=1 Tax=Thermococcus onnurineus (strain NA1) TaxID=523850 RepID=B6YW24_THEON|nr:hypothetical protein TON_0859 [Thermococcus onnurineus NA1]
MLFYEKDDETYVAINTVNDVLDIIKEPLEVVKSVIEDL